MGPCTLVLVCMLLSIVIYEQSITFTRYPLSDFNFPDASTAEIVFSEGDSAFVDELILFED